MIDTPEGRRVGSSVVEFRSHLSPSFPGPEAGGVNYNVIGEAAAVRLPGDRYLFAVLKWKRPENRFVGVVAESFADRLGPQLARLKTSGTHQPAADMIRAISKLHGVRAVPSTEYPILAYFRNRADPATVQTVAPDALSAAFGPGYRIIGMTVEITDAEVTHQIEAQLPWLKRSEHWSLDPKTNGMAVDDMTEAQLLDHADFARGESQ